MSRENSSAPALLVGLGDLGGRIARQVAALEIPVLGMRRQPVPLHGITTLAHDATRPWDAVAALDAETPGDVVLCLAPPQRSAAGYEAAYLEPARQGLAWLQHRAPQARVWLISSTSVYAQQDGQWVTEDSPAQPERETARIIRAAEQLWLDSPQPATVLRPAGLYGPGRDFLLRQAEQGYLVPDQRPIYTNRIHVADAARAVAHLIMLWRREGVAYDIVNLADREPVALQALLPQLQRLLGVPFTGELRESGRGSKRVSSDRLAASGFRWAYPGWREGYAEMIEQRQADANQPHAGDHTPT